MIKESRYINKIDPGKIEKLKEMVGKNLFLFKSNSGNAAFSLYPSSTCSFSALGNVTIVFHEGNNFYTWNLSCPPLGDTYIGDDLYEIKLAFSKNQACYKPHNSNTKPSKELNDYNVTFNVQEKISQISIYGISIDTYRYDDGKLMSRVEADTDLLLVFKTISERLVIIKGNGRTEGVIIKVYPSFAHNEFHEHFLNRKNHWGENLYTLRQTIS